MVGAPTEDDGGRDTGSAYVFTRSGSTFTQQAKLGASDRVAGDQFGAAVAVEGDVVLVGAPFTDDGGSGAGSAYVFTRSGTTFAETAELTAPDAASQDHFGRRVALSGGRGAIGTPGDDNKGTDSGSGSVFALPSTERVAKLVAADGAFGDSFGSAVDIDDDTVLVGARNADRAGNTSGAAYVFAESGSGYLEQGQLAAPDSAAFDEFGFSVAVDADAFLVGIPDDDDAGSSSGSAYTFVAADEAPEPVIPEVPTAVLLPLAAAGAAALTIGARRRRAAQGV